MLNVFADLRADEKRLRDMEMKMAELTGADLDKLMTDYDRLSEDFRQRGGFTYESDIRAILNGFKFDESMWEMPISDLSGGKTRAWLWRKCCLRSPNSWYWTNRQPLGYRDHCLVRKLLGQLSGCSNHCQSRPVIFWIRWRQ